MDDKVAGVILTFIFFGWIPILALGSAISSIIRACKYNEISEVDDDESSL